MGGFFWEGDGDGSIKQCERKRTHLILPLNLVPIITIITFSLFCAYKQQ